MPFKSHISFYLQLTPAGEKVEVQWETERERDGGGAGEAQPQQDALHYGRLREKQVAEDK